MCSWKQRDLMQVILQYLLVVPVTVVFQQNQSMIIIVRVMCMCWWNNYSVYYILSSIKSNWTDLDHNRINLRNMKIYSREKGEQMVRGRLRRLSYTYLECHRPSVTRLTTSLQRCPFSTHTTTTSICAMMSAREMLLIFNSWRTVQDLRGCFFLIQP